MVLDVGETAKIAEIVGHFTHTKEVNELFTRRLPEKQLLQLPEHVLMRLPVEMGMKELRKAEIRPYGA